VQGGFFLRKKPLEGLPSVYSNSQTALNALFAALQNTEKSIALVYPLGCSLLLMPPDELACSLQLPDES
jgi:hypothetical protein